MLNLSLFPLLLMFILSAVAAHPEEDETWNMFEINRDFTCPSNVSISPCFCHEIPLLPAIHCSGVRSLKTLNRMLAGGLVENHIPYLKILDSPLSGLPSRAFRNLNVTRLMISNSNLAYVAPDAFEGLQSLMLLVLDNVRLFDFPAVPLSRLPSLITLSLVNNKLSRLTTDDLRDLNNVRYFGLRENRLAHIERGAFPSGLVMLSLSKNHLLSLNKTVRHLPYLETLFLQENRLTTIDGELDGLFSLKYLYLGNNLLRTLGNSFCELRNLKTLDLRYNSIYDIGGSLSNLGNLHTLNLSQNILFRLNQRSFQGLTSLEILHLSGNHLMSLEGALTPLTGVISLDLSKNGLYNFTFNEIQNMCNLKVLDLDENHLSVIDSNFLTAVPTIDLQMLFVSKNQLSNLEGFLHHFPSLNILDVSFNFMTRLWSRNFINSEKLDYINVQGNPLVCDVHQLHVLQELAGRHIEVEGMPECEVTPDTL